MTTSLIQSTLTGISSDVPWTPPEKLGSRFRIARGCASSDCPHRGKLWPSWLRIAASIQFEGRTYCSALCLTPALEQRIRKLQSGFANEKPRSSRMPVGLLLLQRGLVSQDQLRTALGKQREAGKGRIGYWLRELGLVDEHSLTSALAQQYGCAVFPLERL